jgi:sigma-E factor negative regulatory protein RseB
MALMPRSLAGSPLLLLTLVGSHAMAQEAGKWLDRMNRAVDELNYRGTFMHVIDGTSEALNIVHRNVAGNSGERILSLDGPRREIVRENDQVRWILPDQKLVLLETRKDVSPLVSALPSYSADLEPHYEINLRATARIANRSAQMIEIKPRDDFRYGYVLWLDQETAMPLKSQLMDERGHTVEQIQFTEINMVSDITAADLEPTINTDGFATMRPPESAPLVAANVPWRASAVPGGFKLSAATQSPMPGSKYPVEHLVYSDGLATVSVFIEDPKTKPEVNDGFSKVGSTNTFSLTLRGRKVTAVGEVPRQTVRTIASSLVAE